MYILNTAKHLKWRFFAKIVNGQKLFTIFAKHTWSYRCFLIGFKYTFRNAAYLQASCFTKIGLHQKHFFFVNVEKFFRTALLEYIFKSQSPIEDQIEENRRLLWSEKISSFSINKISDSALTYFNWAVCWGVLLSRKPA